MFYRIITAPTFENFENLLFLILLRTLLPNSARTCYLCSVVSFTYVAGQMRGVGLVFSKFLEVDINTGVIIGMIIVLFMPP
jgi:Na+(H+)/acetate symporter ActP